MPLINSFCCKYSLRTGCITIVWVNLLLDAIATIIIVKYWLPLQDKNIGNETIAAYIFTVLLLMEQICIIYAMVPLYINRTKLSAMLPLVGTSTINIAVMGATLFFLCMQCEDCFESLPAMDKTKKFAESYINPIIILLLIGLKTYAALIVYSYYKTQRDTIKNETNNVSGSAPPAETVTSSPQRPTSPLIVNQPSYSPYYPQHSHTMGQLYVPQTPIAQHHFVTQTYIPQTPISHIQTYAPQSPLIPYTQICQ